MKQGIHPEYGQCTVTCGSCGTSWETRATRKELRIELCSNCHPLFTGKDVLVDAAGQIDKFNQRLSVSKSMQGSKQPVQAAPATGMATDAPTEDAEIDSGEDAAE